MVGVLCQTQVKATLPPSIYRWVFAEQSEMPEVNFSSMQWRRAAIIDILSTTEGTFSMTIYPLLPQAQGYGYEVGILLLNLVETHAPGDTAHVGTYDYPVLLKVVEAADVSLVTHGDKSIEKDIVSAALELEQMGVKAISSNCGFMLHYQDAIRDAVNIPVYMSSLLQLPMIARSIKSNKKIAILTAFTERLTDDVLQLAGLTDGKEVVVNSIQTSPEFLNMQEESLDTDAFGKRLEAAAQELFDKNGDIGALLLECAVFTPYAARLQRKFGVAVYDFISLIDYANQVTHRKSYT
jgi:Asp/Glu/hydantoin racemase